MKVRNRVLVSAHVPGFAENNLPGEKYIAYHRQYADGGVGLQITGGTPVHKSGLLSTSGDGLWNLSDEIIPGYQKLAAAVHEKGGRILAQLAHSAGTVLINQPGYESWSASAIRSKVNGNISHAMSKTEIEEVIDAYAAAAVRVRKGELDGVEILSAFGFLPHAFLSPLSNWREDDYGGSLENRMRFLVELLKATRDRLGPEQILGVRVSGDEFEQGGLNLDQMKEICQQLSRSRLVDYINVIAHTNFSQRGRAKHWAPTPAPYGVFVSLATAIKSVVDVPVFCVGRIVDPRHAESIIATDQADMIGMTRAHICDPDIVRKIKANQLKQIRPCVGANTCIANRYAGKTIRCMHNPDVAIPGKAPPKNIESKTVAVIGAGPAGLEAARAAAEMGHQVEIFEENDHVGGQLALWATSQSMRELGKIIQWRVSELKRLAVPVHLNHRIETADLDKLKFKVIVVATGSVSKVREFSEISEIPCISPLQLLRGYNIDARHALVCNDGRGQAGLVAAEWLLLNNISVEMITTDDALAADLDPTHRYAWYERLGKLGMQTTAQTEISNLNGRIVSLRNVYSEQTIQRQKVDLIVDWSGCKANDQLLKTCSDNEFDLSRKFQWHAIGDCIAPRNVEVAMAEAATVVNQI